MTRKIGQKLAYAGAVIGFIVSMMQLVAGKRLEAVVVILSFFAGLFTLGSALKYICRNALAYTPSNLRSTEDSMNRVNVSVVNLINLLARVDLALRQDSAELQLHQDVADPAVVLGYLDRRLD